MSAAHSEGKNAAGEGRPAADNPGYVLKAPSFGWHLGALALGLVAPALVAIGLLLIEFANGERTRVEAEARGLARMLAAAVDREIDNISTTLQALATSPSLRDGDIANFDAQARALSMQLRLHISVRDLEGNSVLTTRLPFGERVPNQPEEVRAADRVALAQGRPMISDLFVGPVTRAFNLQIATSAPLSGPPRYLLGASLDPEFFHRALQRFERAPDWIVSIIDGNGRVVAREPDHASHVGQLASADFRRATIDLRGQYYGLSPGGAEALVAYDTSSSSGWKVNVSLPQAIVSAHLRQGVATFAALSIPLCLIGFALAWLIRARLARAVAVVGGVAEDLRTGKPPRSLDGVEVAEIGRIGRSLVDASAELRRSENQLRRVLDNLFAFVGLLDLDGRVREANAAPLALAGITRDDVIGQFFWQTPWWEGMPEECARVREAVEAAARGETRRFDLRVRGHDRVIVIDFQIAPLSDDHGTIIGLQPSGVDVTERVMAETELGRREARSRFLADLRERLDLEAEPTAILVAAASATGEHLATDFGAVMEIDAERGQLVAHAAHGAPCLPSGRYPVATIFNDAMLARLTLGLPFPIADTQSDPAVADRRDQFNGMGVRACLAVPLLRSGRLVGALALGHASPRAWDEEIELVRTVAERAWNAAENARLMKALVQSEERLRGFANANIIGMLYGDIEGGISFANDEFLRIIGRSRADLETGAIRWDEITPAEWLEADRLHIAEARERGACTPYEKAYVRPDGQHVPVLIGYTLAEPARQETVCFILDLTEAKRVESELAKALERLEVSTQAAEIGSWEYDPARDDCTWNAEAQRLFGFPPDWSFTHQAWIDLIHPDDRAHVERALHATLADPSVPYDTEFRVARPEGGWRWLIGRGRAFAAPDGKTARMAGINLDITARKELEERQALLIRELHHRVKNTLATVQAIAGQTMRSAPDMESFRDSFAARLSSLGRSHTLLTENAWEGASLKDLLVLELEPYGLGERIVLDGPPVAIPVTMAVAFGMGFHELATNAAKHGALSDPKGRLTVRWQVMDGVRDPQLRLEWTERGGPPVSEPDRQGFGSRLLNRVMAPQIQGQIRIDYAPEGIHAEIEAPLPPPSSDPLTLALRPPERLP